jgi:hypothetical protein
MRAAREAGTGVLEHPATFWLALVLATAVGAWVRFTSLEAPSLWVDEFFTIARAGRDPLHWTSALGYLPSRFTLWWQDAELARIGLDNVEQWRELGVTELGARLGPCFVGLLSIPILGLLARPVVGGGVAAVATLLLAVAPWHLYSSQMARYYTTQFLFANVFLLLFARGASTGSRLALGGSLVACVLTYLSHPTALVGVGICAGWLLLARLARAEGIAFLPAALTLAACFGGCAIVYLFREMAGGEWKGLESFSGQDWDPSILVLALGTAQRVDLVVGGVAALSAWGLLRARHPIGVLLAAVALLSPLGYFVLKAVFPIAPRYYFFCLYAWLLLAGIWAVEIDRRIGAAWGPLAGVSGAVALLASVGTGAYLYLLDGAGHRERWRDAYAVVGSQREPRDHVVAHTSGMQARYYLGPGVPIEPSARPGDAQELAAGTWIVLRDKLPLPARYSGMELHAQLSIAAKPWSHTVFVLRVPEASAGRSEALQGGGATAPSAPAP